MVDSVNATLSVAVAQPMVVPGDVAGNLQRMEPLILQAAREGSKLILFSENALNGYDHHGVGAASAISIDAPAIQRLKQLSKQTDQAIVAGFFEKEGDRIFNSAAVVMPDGKLIVQRKFKVTPLEVQSGHVQAGPEERTIFEYRGFRFAVLICADGGIEKIHQKLSAAGCDVILAPTAGLGSDEKAFHQQQLGDPKIREEYLKAAATVCFISPQQMLENDLSLICCNQMGYSREHRFFHCGHAAVIDRTGETTALIPGRFVVEHLRPVVAVGFITRRNASHQRQSQH